MLSPKMLHSYQRKAIKFILSHPHAGLWIGLGLGKTIITLTALEELVNSMTVNNVLVIAPLRVCNSVWKQEAQKWAHTSDLIFSICTGSLKDRTTALMQSADVYVINRENVVWITNYFGKRMMKL